MIYDGIDDACPNVEMPVCTLRNMPKSERRLYQPVHVTDCEPLGIGGRLVPNWR